MYEIILLQLLLQRVMTAPDHPMLNAFNQQLSRKDNMAALEKWNWNHSSSRSLPIEMEKVLPKKVTRLNII